MYVRSTRGRIPGISHRGRKSTNGSRQSPGSRQLGTPQEPQGTTRLDGLHQFLQKVHRRILKNRAELRHLRQRTISSRKITPSLEDVPRRSPTSNSHPHRPLKPPVLEGTSKN